MAGWIKLHRKLTDNPLWFSEKFTRGQAWVDLLLLANYEDSFYYKRGVKVVVKRGQVGRSEVELAVRWSWSRSKVRKFLNGMEKEQQIIQHKTNVTQLVTIVNYDIYQNKEQQTEQQSEQQKNSKRTAEKHIKEEEEEKEEKEEKNNIDKFNLKKSFLNLGVENQILEDWLKVRKTKKATNTETSYKRIKKQIEISGLTANECIEIAVWKDWKGFEASWLDNLKISSWSNGKTPTEDRIKRLNELMKKREIIKNGK